MEKNTIVIEIRQEVAIMLGWLVVGVVLVVVAFFIPEQTTEFWPSINAAGVVAGAYIVALLLYTLRRPLSLKARLTMGILSAFVLFEIAVNWSRQEVQSYWQKTEMLKTREMLGRGIMLHQIPGPLFNALNVYHQQGAKKREALGQVFQRLNPEAMVGANIHKPYYPQDSLKVFVQTLTDGEIVLVGQEAFVKGNDPQFKNFDGKRGMAQEAFVLTEKGITHESQN